MKTLYYMDDPQFKTNPDKSYGWAEMDVAESVATLATLNGLTALSKVKLDTIGKIESYNKVVDNFSNLASDMTLLSRFSGQLAQQVEANGLDDIPIDTVAPFQTYVKQTSASLISDITHFLPEAKAQLSDEDYAKVESSLSMLIWINANVTQGRKYPGRYSVEELVLLGNVFKKLSYFIGGIERGYKPDASDEARDKAKVLLKKKDIPIVARVLGGIISYGPMIGDLVKKSCDLLGEGVKNLGDAVGASMQWGNFKTNPIGAIVNVMNGLVGVVLAGGAFTAQAFSMSSETIGNIKKNTDEKARKRLKSMSPLKMVGVAIGSIAKTLTSAMSGITNLVANVFQATFTAFTSTLTSVMNLLKSIAETSPVLKSILGYVSLAMSMFFLSFFTAFGDSIMDAVMNTISVLMEMGMVFVGWLQSADNSVREDIDRVLSSLVTQIKDLEPQIIEMIKEFAPLVPALLRFILLFAQTIISHTEDIMNLLRVGIASMNVLVANNIIGLMINIGTEVFKFMTNNQGLMIKITDFIIDIIKKSLNFAGWALNNMKLTAVAILTSVGAACGAIGGAQVGTAGAIVSLGLSIPAAIAAGAALGGSAGAGAATYVIMKWIDPATDYLASIKNDVSEFASGGKIYGRRGGHIGLLGEAGQGEFAIPESKLDLFRGNNNIILRFNKGVHNQKEVESVLKELQSERSFTYVFE